MSLTEVLPGQFRLGGAITFATSPDVEQQGRTLLLATTAADWSIDLADVTCADSAALAVCLAWARLAGENQKTITFANVPNELIALARVCGVEELLGISLVQESTNTHACENTS